MRTLLAVGIALGSVMVAADARAERTTTVQLGGMFGGIDNPTDDLPNMLRPAGGPRVTLAWEHAPLAMPAAPGYAVDVGLVPELTAAAILNEDRGEVLIGVGARGELRVSQRERGLLKISARMAFYLAARAMVIGDRQDTAFEGALGEYVYLGNGRTRLGGEIGVVAREQTTFGTDVDVQVGVFASAYLGWAL